MGVSPVLLLTRTRALAGDVVMPRFSDSFYMGLSVVMGLCALAAFYLGVVKPNDEIAREIIYCMDTAGDVHSREFYEKCRREVMARRP